MTFYLIVARGKRRGMPIPVEVDLFVIGRARECQLRADHPDIGEQHCALVIRRPKVFIRDLGSGKATRVNDDVLPASGEWPLHRGDRIAVGPLQFMVNFREKQLDQRDLEEWALKQLDEDTGPKKSALEELAEIGNAPVQEGDASSVASGVVSRLGGQKGVVRGRLRIAQEGRLTIVRINDVHLVDPAELALVRKELHDNPNHPNLRVLIDFKDVRRMSTAAAELFAELTGWLRQYGSTLALCRLRPELAVMMGDMQQIFDFKIFTDKDVARDAKW